MITSTLRSLLERAAGDPAFRAQLLVNPALAEGLTREQIDGLLGEMALLDDQLTDAMLDSVAGGGMSRTNLGLMGIDAVNNPRDCVGTINHNEGSLRVKAKAR